MSKYRRTSWLSTVPVMVWKAGSETLLILTAKTGAKSINVTNGLTLGPLEGAVAPQFRFVIVRLLRVGDNSRPETTAE
ncbi:hypothetical protein NKJ06_33115 [Mesorhizobium sp. M0293]|uniref:hypothetical protein n=1 Tax=Mesorhizobium sp. M0293 TaxID=2956930 RepID=UPI00333B7818